jgi:chloramphenicol-sensitive protein RarD
MAGADSPRAFLYDGGMPSTTRLPGPVAALGAYLLWGFMPLYWKIMMDLPAQAILAFRIIFALVFVAMLLLARRRLDAVLHVFREPRKALLVAVAAVLISVNWGIYIWAVNAGQVVETALGYYINPLVSICLGMVFFRERLNPRQWGAVALGLGGVVVLGLEYGRLPWIALSLAFSFGLYGLIKKLLGINSLVSLGLETLFALPLAIILLLTTGVAADPANIGTWGWILVMLAGPITAIPLMLFGHAASRIPLSMLGFIQYVSPSINLVLGIFVFHEAFSLLQLASFACIWAALAVFSLDQWHASFRKRAAHAIVAE